MSGTITPTAYFLGLLNQINSASISGTPAELGGLLQDLAPRMNDFGRSEWATQLSTSALHLQNGEWGRTDFLRSRNFGALEKLRTQLENGTPLEEALTPPEVRQTLDALTSAQPPRHPLFRPPPRQTVGPAPQIDWSSFGSARFPAPRPPSESVKTAGQRLSYFAYYVAGITGHGETETAVEQFYQISDELRRRLQGGLFAPDRLGQFPSSSAHKLLFRAHKTEPLYGQLMRELLIQSFFESQQWSLGLPLREAPWSISFLYALRRFVAQSLLTDAGKASVLEDETLVKAVRNLLSFEQVGGQGQRTRREIFEDWLHRMNPKDAERQDSQRSFIGNGILQEIGWKRPAHDASPALHFQWMVRYWIAHHHYGCLPARGLPIEPKHIVRFAFASRPTQIHPEFAGTLLTLMSDFYDADEIHKRKTRRGDKL